MEKPEQQFAEQLLSKEVSDGQLKKEKTSELQLSTISECCLDIGVQQSGASKAFTFGIPQSEGVTPINYLGNVSSPHFTSTPVLNAGTNLGFEATANHVITPNEDLSPNRHRGSGSVSVFGSVADASINSPYPCTVETTVFIFIDDLLISSAVSAAGHKVDDSLSKEKFIELRSAYNPILLASTPELEQAANEKLHQTWGSEFTSIVSTKSVKEMSEELKKGSMKLVVSDELFFKQSPGTRMEAMASGGLILFASLFTKNENWISVDYNKVVTGRGAGSIASKLQFGHVKDRTLVGLFIEGSYFNPKLVKVFEDTETVNFVPVLFNDIPSIEFDYLFQRVNSFKAKIILSNDDSSLPAKKVFDNYMKYEEKCKNCVIIDRYEWSKAMMLRSEFMEVLKEHCEMENERVGKDVFNIPWTRSGDYLDVLNNPSTDSMIVKLCNSIPYPLITKSDLACGSSHTHSFMIIKERPQDWSALKASIEGQYMKRPFIVQNYISIEDNLVVKGMYFLGEFCYDLRAGMNQEAQSESISSGTFIEQKTDSIKKKDDHPQPTGNSDKKHHGNDQKAQKPEGVEIDAEIIQLLKDFTISLAERMKLYLLGIDFLVQRQGGHVKILPIDLNKMPRPDKIEGFRDTLLRSCNTKSSYIQLTPSD